jgi:hypothetical protein
VRQVGVAVERANRLRAMDTNKVAEGCQFLAFYWLKSSQWKVINE